MLCDVPWAPITHTYIDTPLNSSTGTCINLVYHCTSTQTRNSINTDHTILQEYVMDGWMKTVTLLAFAFDGVWWSMSSNHPYRCWHPSQFINGCMGQWVYVKQGDHTHTDVYITQHSYHCGVSHPGMYDQSWKTSSHCGFDTLHHPHPSDMFRVWQSATESHHQYLQQNYWRTKTREQWLKNNYGVTASMTNNDTPPSHG